MKNVIHPGQPKGEAANRMVTQACLLVCLRL
jgi:hypothetical protein